MEELVTDSRGGGWGDPSDDGDWIGTIRLTESGERRELFVRKSCFVSNFFIYSFNFYSPFAALPLYFANSHIPLYLSILSLMITGKTNKKRIHWTAQDYRISTSLSLA
jgi:hypothetical protein